MEDIKDVRFMSKRDLQLEVIHLRNKLKEYKYIIDMQKFIITSYGDFIDSISYKEYFGGYPKSSDINTPRPDINTLKKKG